MENGNRHNNRVRNRELDKLVRKSRDHSKNKIGNLKEAIGKESESETVEQPIKKGKDWLHQTSSQEQLPMITQSKAAITDDIKQDGKKENEKSEDTETAEQPIKKDTNWLHQTSSQEQLPMITQSKAAITDDIKQNDKKENEKSEDTGTVGIYYVEKYLLEKEHFIRDIECHLYYYDGSTYVMAVGHHWDEFVKRSLPEDMLRKIRDPVCFLQETFKRHVLKSEDTKNKKG